MRAKADAFNNAVLSTVSQERSVQPVNIRHDIDLSPYSTFGFAQRAAHLVEVRGEQELEAAVQMAQQQGWPILALGSGSNLVFAQDFPGLVIRQIDEHIRYQSQLDSGETHVTASAGVSWHGLVMDTVRRQLIGLENLSLIPGQVGAAPVQNIGAYGVELCDRFVSLRALHLPSRQWQTLQGSDCDFSYRNSLFKQHEGDYIISEVTLRLGEHLGLQIGYSALADYLAQHHAGQTPDASMVSDAVCAVRSAKLPDPAELPNAGSFFHNPVIDETRYTALRERFPDLVAYRQDSGDYKLAAGWLIDKLGYKGYREDGVGVHDKQALVLIKYRQTDAQALVRLAGRIREHVQDVFGVSLHIEPRIL